jgi:SET domain-containing protein
MTAIQEIIIKVPSNIAEAYSRATDIQRQQIAVKIGIMLTGVMSEKADAIDRLKQQMNDISSEATINGLTPEILESILNKNRCESVYLRCECFGKCPIVQAKQSSSGIRPSR